MLYYILLLLHVIVCVIVILVVLLQSGKSADLAGAFGGGGTQTAFGSRGPASFLSKLTTIAAVVFMITSISLSGIVKKDSGASVLDSGKSKAAPVSKVPGQAQPQAVPPTPEEIRKMQQEAEAKQQAAPPPVKSEGGEKPPAPPKQNP